jgi:peroxiredoxin Q/BCP
MAPHPLIDEPAPEFSIPDANGEMFKFPPEEQGQRVRKPIALFFYPESGKELFVHMHRSEGLN